MAGALEGIRVVEFANYVSGPYAGMLLGDMGAEVIKVEAPDGGDPFRGWGRVEYSPTFGSVNRNKKSIVLDLKSADGDAEARALTRTADVLIENFRTGTMERLGLGYTRRARDNPGARCGARSRATARTGPYASRPGYDTVGQATQRPPQPAHRSRPPKADGHLAVRSSLRHGGVQWRLGALVARGRTGKGQTRRHFAARVHGFVLRRKCSRFFENRKVPGRATRTHQAQVYAFVAGRKSLRRAPVVADEILGWRSPRRRQAGMVRGQRFATKETRGSHYDVLHEGLAAVFKGDTRAAWLAKLHAEDVPAAPLNTLDEVFADPQVEHLGMRQDVRTDARHRRARCATAYVCRQRRPRNPLCCAGARRAHRRNPRHNSRPAREMKMHEQ